MKTKLVRILIMGFGNIGSGVAEAIRRRRESIEKEYGLVLKIVGIADLKGVIINKGGLTEEEIMKFKRGENKEKMSDSNAIKEIDYEVMVEATPTNIENGEPGLTHIINALESGRHVVTSNKGPLALAYGRLAELAVKKGKCLKYGATVGGSLPIISLAKNELAGREVVSIKGIFNGTSNYILTRMTKEGLPYEQALKEAQAIGIAESEPSKDVDGIDTAIKLVILANSVFGRDVSHKDVETTGIREITPEALKLADGSGHAIKLIGEINQTGCPKVAPRLVPKDDPLNVGGTLNVATIKTALADDMTIIGKGAGPIETASAILSDIIGIYRNNE